MCVGISGVLTDSVFVLMCVDVCLRLCLFVRNKAVVCQNFRNGDERKQHLHDILTKRRIISLLLVMAQDWTHGLRLDPPDGAERKQHLHDVLTKRRMISLLLVMAQDWFKVALVWDVEYNSGIAQWLEAGPTKWP